MGYGDFFTINDPLDKIIERINERYKGNFSEADRVMIGALAEKLRKGTALPDLDTSWLKEESEHADSAYRTCGIPD